MENFIKKFPKIELHAHLNGSLSNHSIQELGKLLYGENTEEFLRLASELTQFEGQMDLNKCFEKFKFVHDLTATREGLALATELAIKEFADDNVIYLELRTTPKENHQMSQKQYLETVLESMQQFETKHKNIKVKLLASFDRSKPVSQAEKTLKAVVKLKELYPDHLVGIDLSGNPYIGNFEDFKPLLSEARECSLNLSLHCGEVDNQREIDSMIEFGMSRCGHGTFLKEKHLNALAAKDIAIESCLTSNVKCKTVASYETHHFKNIYFTGQPIVLCTDDSGIFDTTLSKEFSLAEKYYKLEKLDFVKLNITAAESSFASFEEKEELHYYTKSYM